MDLTAVAHARQFAKPRYNVQQQSRRERDACTPRRQPHWLAARGSYPAPTEGSCAPSRPLVCPSVRPSHVTRAARCAHRPEKSLRVIEKSMSAWRAGSRPAATNGCHGARTGAKEASAVSGSREGGGRGAHGRRALAAEEEMAESREVTPFLKVGRVDVAAPPLAGARPCNCLCHLGRAACRGSRALVGLVARIITSGESKKSRKKVVGVRKFSQRSSRCRTRFKRLNSRTPSLVHRGVPISCRRWWRLFKILQAVAASGEIRGSESTIFHDG